MNKIKEPMFNLNKEEKITIAQKAASNALHKKARVTIPISASDLKRIKQIATFEGLPYQTLIASVLHKYSAGYLHDNT